MKRQQSIDVMYLGVSKEDVERMVAWGKAHPDYKGQLWLCRELSRPFTEQDRLTPFFDSWALEHDKIPEYWAIYTQEQKGYSVADERYPIEDTYALSHCDSCSCTYKEQENDI